jgi:tetratricopeptide (TPR) repeat protein
MVNLAEQKQKANQLRKAGEFEDSLQLYRSLWEGEGDKFDGAGLLHCLRKLGLFDEAVVFANELIDKYPDFDWCRREVIWTLISGQLNKLEETEPFEKVLQTAQKIMDLKPDDLAKKKVVFKILKSAKSSNHWKIVNEWVVNIDPASLSTEPMTDSSGREGWCDQSLWYNYRINGLIQQGDPKEAIVLVDEILEHFPKQRKFFLRLKALANHSLGNFPESEKIYQDLCSRYKPDWWLLHEYAKVVRDIGRKEDALKLMYRAASSNQKLESMVALFVDIGMLCKTLELYDDAKAHLILCKYIRNEKGWSVPESITDTINELDKIIGNKDKPSSLKEALSLCRTTWNHLLDKDNFKELSIKRQKIKKGLVGKVSFGQQDRPYCFINSEGTQSFFCHKSDLPPDTKDGNEVVFDAIPSFDKKKNKESWKASNVQVK